MAEHAVDEVAVEALAEVFERADARGDQQRLVHVLRVGPPVRVLRMAVLTVLATTATATATASATATAAAAAAAAASDFFCVLAERRLGTGSGPVGVG